MAGMLPGVECARRRRLNQNSDSFGCSTRRSSFCLYTSNHDNSSPRSTFSLQRSMSNYEDEKLEETARQAKERLDGRLRLRTQRKSLSRTNRHSSKGSSRGEPDGGETLQTERSGSKKSILSLVGLKCLV